MSKAHHQRKHRNKADRNLEKRNATRSDRSVTLYPNTSITVDSMVYVRRRWLMAKKDTTQSYLSTGPVFFPMWCAGAWGFWRYIPQRKYPCSCIDMTNRSCPSDSILNDGRCPNASCFMTRENMVSERQNMLLVYYKKTSYHWIVIWILLWVCVSVWLH